MKFFAKIKKIIALSFYCSTLLAICQAFCPISIANAVTYSTNYYVNSFSFEDFTADYYLSKAEDGTSRMRVVEQFTAKFPTTNQNHGITRVIPFTNQDGNNLTMASDQHLNIKIKHNGIEEKPYKIEADDGYFTVYIGDPDYYVHDVQYYQLEYEFRYVITDQEEDGKKWQELYWDTNGNDWSQSFDKLTARVHFEGEAVDDGATGEAWCYVGKYGDGDQSRCQVLHTTDGFEFRATKLKARENLTFDIEFKPDTFTINQPLNDYRFVLALIITIVFGLGVTGFCICLWHNVANKRKAYRDTFVKPEYQPPKGFTVAEMAENYMSKGTLGSSRVATLMELAVQHKIEIVQNHTNSKSKNKWTVRIKSLNLNAEQVAMLKILAGSDESLTIGQEIIVKSHTANSTLIQLGTDFDHSVRDVLRKQGLLEFDEKKAAKLAAKTKKTNEEPHPKNPCGILMLIGFLWFFAGIMSCAFLLDDVPTYRHLVGGWGLFTATVLIFLAVLAFIIATGAHLNPYYTHTVKGLEYSRYLEGLKLYIKMAEKDRLEFLQSVKGADTSHQGVVNLYEKLLPYAVIFKLEKSWLKEMSKYYEYSDVTAPVWYAGIGAFSADNFSSAISSASSFMATTTTHSTTSNSSSGFSGGGGGGFSGGGGGGGGGGGW